MRRTLAPYICLSLLLFCAADGRAQDSIRDLVVKIHAVHHTPDLLRPWTKNSPQQVKGSGAIIDGKRILTNAFWMKRSGRIAAHQVAIINRKKRCGN